MYYYEVLVRSAGGPKPQLTYQSALKLRVNTLVKAPLGRQMLTGLIVKEAKQPSFKTKSITPLTDTPLPNGSRKLLEWLASYYGVSPAMALKLVAPSGLPKSQHAPTPATTPSRGFEHHKPSPAQSKAIKQISHGPNQTYLLHGQTASGKTLVYRELAKQALTNQQSVVILLPEINLTPQLAADFSDLTEQLYVSHSGLSEAQRQRIWLYCLQQKLPFLLIGPRSTLFYPFKKLGLVVVDEAHEQSYKQDQAPRFQAQTVAAKLAEIHGAKLVLGSATPRIGDYWLAKEKKLPILTLPRHNSRPPSVEVIDQKQPANFSHSQILSNELVAELKSTLTSGHQSLLYLNRRGTAAMALCNQCGWVPLCQRCEVPIRLHHDVERLICHQCGLATPVPVNCPVCASTELTYRGAGTKAIEREVKRLLPQARVKRFDGDSPAAESFERLYQQVLNKEIDVLIGTQGLANGLDLPGLKLVGVVSADSELYLPDFSAAERAFQLLYQVVGRAGRSGGGKVIIQTHNPVHPAIVKAIDQDYAGFYKFEIELRQKHGYPPFSYLLALVLTSSSADKGRHAAQAMSGQLATRFGLSHVLGPAPAWRHKHGKNYRYLLVVKSPRRPVLAKAAAWVGSQPGWQTDLDPINLLF